jgi:hypothetical protein
MQRRAVVLKDILEDVKTSTSPPPEGETYTSPANYDRLFHLYWKGTGEWKKGAKKGPSRRMDAGEQPKREILVKALWFVRALINTYRQATAGTGQSGTNPVWELPVYGKDPYAVREDRSERDDQDDQEGEVRDHVVRSRRPRIGVPPESLMALEGAEDEGDEGRQPLPRERALVLLVPPESLAVATRGRPPERGRRNTRCTSIPGHQRSAPPHGSNRPNLPSRSARRIHGQSAEDDRRIQGQSAEDEMDAARRTSPDRVYQADQDRDHGRDGKVTRPRRSEPG